MCWWQPGHRDQLCAGTPGPRGGGGRPRARPLLLEAPGGLSQGPGLAWAPASLSPRGVGGQGLWLEGAFSAALQLSAGEGGPEAGRCGAAPPTPCYRHCAFKALGSTSSVPAGNPGIRPALASWLKTHSHTHRHTGVRHLPETQPSRCAGMWQRRARQNTLTAPLSSRLQAHQPPTKQWVFPG